MKISSMDRIISVVFVILAVLLEVSLFGLNSSFKNYQNSTTRQMQFKQLGMDLSEASDLLTSSAQNYAVTGDRKYYDNHMEEVNHRIGRSTNRDVSDRSISKFVDYNYITAH